MTKKTETISQENLDLEEIPAEEKFRWALKQHLCAQIREYDVDLFDQVDDFLFDRGQQGHSIDEGSYLKVMRDIRTRKELFEEQFLDSTSSSLDSILRLDRSQEVIEKETAGSSSEEERSEKSALKPSESLHSEVENSVYEQIEIDLALNDMQRKAIKLYTPLIKKLENAPDSLSDSDSNGSIEEEEKDILVKIVIQALGNSHGVFNLSLEFKLVFLKLFERYFLQNMEPMYKDLINMINNQGNLDFVDDLYASALANQQETSNSKKNQSISIEATRGGLKRSEIINENVIKVIDELCVDSKLLGHLKAMLQTHWRDVMFLIGLNKGIDTAEWNAAKNTVTTLLKMVACGRSMISDDEEVDEIKTRLRRGFDLAQLSRAEQDDFFNKLETTTVSSSEAKTMLVSMVTSNTQMPVTKSASKVSISEAGRQILDDEDLNDIVAVLSKVQNNDEKETDDSLITYLDLIDGFKNGKEIDFINNGEAQSCYIKKSSDAEISYQVTDKQGQVLLARNRVGLALSIKSGELRLRADAETRSNSKENQRTVLQAIASTNIEPPVVTQVS
ncbi:MAG: DUF1631 family protein [Gammaproteobacteria bacterium]|nr:DUF1631 family protein [Gammaproteobacteria bacterium]